jgi:hypothetical protein
MVRTTAIKHFRAFSGHSLSFRKENVVRISTYPVLVSHTVERRSFATALRLPVRWDPRAVLQT